MYLELFWKTNKCYLATVMGQANFQNKLADVKGCQSTFFGTGVVSMSIRLSTTILVRKGAALFLVRKDWLFSKARHKYITPNPAEWVLNCPFGSTKQVPNWTLEPYHVDKRITCSYIQIYVGLANLGRDLKLNGYCIVLYGSGSTYWEYRPYKVKGA